MFTYPECTYRTVNFHTLKVICMTSTQMKKHNITTTPRNISHAPVNNPLHFTNYSWTPKDNYWLNFLQHKLFWFILELPISENIQYALFHIWLVWFNIMFFRFICLIMCSGKLFILITHCITMWQFLCLSYEDEDLGSFQGCWDFLYTLYSEHIYVLLSSVCLGV